MTTALTRTIARLLLLPTLLISAAVLVKGYASVGDGFSAGVIAAVGVLLQYLSFGYRAVEESFPWLRFSPYLAFGGLLLALAVAFLPTLSGQAVLTHSPPPGGEVAHFGALELHTAVLFDLGVYGIVLGFTVHAMRAIAQVSRRGAP